MDHAERPCSDLFEDVVVVVDGVGGLDVHRLGDVLGVDVEHELVVVLHLALLPADLLPGGRVDWKTKKKKNLVINITLIIIVYPGQPIQAGI